MNKLSHILSIAGLAWIWGCMAPESDFEQTRGPVKSSAGPQFGSIHVATGTVTGEPFTASPEGTLAIGISFSAMIVDLVFDEPTSRQNVIELSANEALTATSSSVTSNFSSHPTDDRGEDQDGDHQGNDAGSAGATTTSGTDDESPGPALNIQGGDSTAFAGRFIRLEDEALNRYKITSTLVKIIGPAHGTSEPTVFVWESVDNPGIDAGLFLLSHERLQLGCGETFHVEVDLGLTHSDGRTASVSMREDVVLSSCASTSAELLDWVTSGQIDAPRK